MTEARAARGVGDALRVASGIVIWAIHFAAIYALTALACARERAAAVPWIVGVATLVAVALAVAAIVVQWRGRSAFEPWLGIGVAGFALLAIVWEAVPLLLVPACA